MSSLRFLQGMRERHGDVFSVRLPRGQPLLIVSDPELVKQVFQAPPDVLLAGEGNHRVLAWLFGDESLIMLDGQRHVRRRRLLLPSLHGRRLERQADAMRATTEAHLDEWPPGEEVAALPRLRALVLDVVMRALFGGEEETELSSLRDVLLKLQTPANAWGGESPTSRHSIDRAKRLVHEVVMRRQGDPERLGDDDMLSLLLETCDESGSPLSAGEICDELMALIVAGTETTAASLAWALERLVRAPQALARVIDDTTGDGAYTDAVIQETLRMRPVVPMSARLVKRPFQLGEHQVAPGVVVAPSALLIHHRSDIYPQPTAFRPERFMGNPPGTYTWIPFGGGTRRCIGGSFALMEMRIVLSCLFSRMTPRSADREQEGMLNQANTMVPVHGGRITLVPRGAGQRHSTVGVSR
jgi:cytochrome P450